ncbi:hypothetical protein ACFE04_024669 [Oxalis oulophora]
MATNQIAFMNINILVVDDDSTSLAIISAMLKIWKYKVVTSKTPMDALSTLRGQGGIDLVVTDLHMPRMNGFELQKIIQLEFDLPVIIMSSDDKESVILESMARGAALYLPKPVKPSDLKNVWQYALKSKRLKLSEILGPIGGGSNINQERRGLITNEKLTNDEVLKSGSSPSINVEMRCNKKRKPYERRITKVDLEHDDQANIDIAPKKTKISWTNSLHTRFLQAMHEIGFRKAVPRKILEVMNVAGLTRANVASHLQKYRLYLKSSTDNLDSSMGITGRPLNSNFVVDHDTLLFGARNQTQHPNCATNLPSTLNFTQQRYPNIRNQNSTNKHAFGLRSYNQSNLYTKDPLLFGSSMQSPIGGKTNNSWLYRQNPKGFGTNLFVNDHSGVAFGRMVNEASLVPIYHQYPTQQPVTGPFGIIGPSSNVVDETSGGENIPNTNVDNNYHTTIRSGFTNNTNNYVATENITTYGATENMTSKGTGQFQFNNENTPSYGGYDMNTNDKFNGNNVTFISSEDYNMVQGDPSYGIWNGSVNNSSKFDAIVQQPPQLSTIVPERCGLAYEPIVVDHRNLINDSIFQIPNEPQQGVDLVTNIKQVFVDPYEPTSDQRSEMQIPNLVTDNINLGGGGGGNEEDIIDSLFEDLPHIFDDNYSKNYSISNCQEDSTRGDNFNYELNNHDLSGYQQANNTENWTDEELAAFTTLE